MKRILILAAFVLTSITAVFAQSKKIESLYTVLSDKSCKTVELNVNEGGYYRGICPGVAGYKLELTEGDLRQTINVIAAKNKRYELDFQQTVTVSFSAVGNKAEWRVVRKGKKIIPIALIIRFNAAKNPVNPEQENSYLVVSKITSDSACVTNVVEPTIKNQNAKARELADTSANKPCKSPQ